MVVGRGHLPAVVSLACQVSRFGPQFRGDRRRIHSKSLPPERFAARAVKFIVVDRAEWHDKLVADFKRKAT